MGKLKWLKDALDMSKAARMKRAAEQGFDVEGVKLWRGTTAINERKLPESFEAGGGVFMSDNQDVAEIFRYPREYGEVLWDEPPGDLQELLLKKGDSRIVKDPKRFSEDTAYQSMVIKEAKRQGVDTLVIKDVMEGVGDTVEPGTTYVALNPSFVRSVNAAFDPANIGKNDLLGAVDPRLLAPIAAGSGIGVAAQMYGDSPEVQRAYQEFIDRRNQKKEIWRKIRQGGEALRTIGQGMAAGIASDAYRLGGYLSPQPVQDTEAQAETLQNKLAYIPKDQNPIIDEIGRQVDQFGRDVKPLVNAFQQTPIYKAYEMLPERAQGVVNVLSNYAF